MVKDCQTGWQKARQEKRPQAQAHQGEAPEAGSPPEIEIRKKPGNDLESS
jgi:hypothetical protein